ncbi:MAG TPA: FKBP-type peptidyl-prolyl cis-trans isomerase [Cytophagaceae bacterium]|jgi:FKBP-type peptidyl-prolyl cis-trans isomerase FkpA|nr:FKBP-type peptidyl-prolyl cis-trans isomerase [Cytophagaceae bacterium]
MNIKKSFLFFAAAFAFMALQSCKDYKTTKDGLKYKIIVDSAGPSIELGGVAYVNMLYTNEKDTFDSKKANMGAPIPIRLPDSLVFKASLEEGLSLLSKGDSASFVISTDSLYKNIFREPIPKEMKPGSMTTFFIRVVKTLTKDSVKALENKMKEDRMIAEQKNRAQLEKDTLAIIEYCKKKNIKVKRTPDGVYYAITKKSGDAITLMPGDTAKTFYTGKLLDGTKFDSNVGKEPFQVVVGYDQVIRGWHSGLMALKKGEQATLFIPSILGYGERGAGASIPPNSILMFEMEVLK